jgi:hypothetical protein
MVTVGNVTSRLLQPTQVTVCGMAVIMHWPVPSLLNFRMRTIQHARGKKNSSPTFY